MPHLCLILCQIWKEPFYCPERNRGVGRFETAPLLHLATELICGGLIALHGTPLILLSDEDTFPTIQPAFPLLEPCVNCQM